MTAPVSIVGPSFVSTTAAAIYTAAVNTTVVFTRAFANNALTTAAQLSLWLVRSGGSRGNSNIIVGAGSAGMPITGGPSEPYIINPLAGAVLNPGDAIHASSDTSSAVVFAASGWTA